MMNVEKCFILNYHSTNQYVLEGLSNPKREHLGYIKCTSKHLLLRTKKETLASKVATRSHLMTSLRINGKGENTRGKKYGPWGDRTHDLRVISTTL